MKKNNAVVLSLIYLFFLSSSLFGDKFEITEEYHSLDIGECSLGIEKNSMMAINNNLELTVSSFNTFNTNDIYIYIIHWQKNAINYIKNNFTKYDYNLTEIVNFKVMKSNKIDIKLVVGRNFYISATKINDRFQKNIIDTCNMTWKDNIGNLDYDMLINTFRINEERIEQLQSEGI